MLSIHRRTVYLLILICLGQVLLISAQVQSRAGVPVLEALTVGGYSRLQRISTWIGDSVADVWYHYFALRGAAIENEDLKRQIVELKGRIQSQEALVSQRHALEAALGLQQSAVVQTVTARVIAGNISADTLKVTIDRGHDDGVEPDMAVISASGVVGRVVNRTARTATVQLLIDRTASAAIVFERTGKGGGNTVGRADDPPLRLEQVPNLADIKPGDRVLTSGLDGIYPPGFLVGTVEVADLNAARRIVTIRPAVDFSLLDIVLVVTTRPVVSR